MQAARAGLVPRVLARDLGRRAPGPRRVHVRGRAEHPGRRREFAVPAIVGDRRDARLVPRWVADARGDGAIGLFVLRMVIAARRRRPGPACAASRSRSGGAAVGADRGARIRAGRDRPVLAALRVRPRRARCRCWTSSQFGRGFLPSSVPGAVRVGGGGRAVARPARARAALGRGAARADRRAAGRGRGAPRARARRSRRADRPARRWRSCSTGSHLAAGSVWIGGLVGLLVLWRSLPAAPASRRSTVAVPRFSNVALGSVLVLVATGTVAAIIQLPTLASLWERGYGQMLLVKIGLLLGALLLAAMNLTRTRPRLLAGRAARERHGGLLLRRLVGRRGGARHGRGVRRRRADEPGAAREGASPISASRPRGPARAPVSGGRAAAATGSTVRVDPNRAAVPNASRCGSPAAAGRSTGAADRRASRCSRWRWARRSTAAGDGAGRYRLEASALVMVGRWGLSYRVRASRSPAGQRDRRRPRLGVDQRSAGASASLHSIACW